MNVIIVGAGKTGAGLAARLAESGHTVTLVEADMARIEMLNAQNTESAAVRVMEGDGADRACLEMAGIRSADIFIAATGRDTLNGLAVQRAMHEFRVPHIFTCARDEDLRILYESIGIRAISPTKLTVDRIVAGTGAPSPLNESTLSIARPIAP